jgi:hypothetical protein
MAQINLRSPVSLSLSAKNWAESKEQSDVRSAQSLASCRRSGCSPAEPYLPHEGKYSIMTIDQPLKRGPLYFAEKGTSLLCIDILNNKLLNNKVLNV